MNRNEKKYLDYVSILHEELRPAMGCTEPIAIAYAAAKARSVLGALPDKVKIEVSGNIIKNVKSVVVPHTGGLRGIPAAAAAGIVAGDENAELEVLSNVQDSQNIEMKEYLDRTPIEVLYAETPHIFDIMITVYTGEETAFVRIVDYHTNMVSIKKNDQVILEKELSDASIGSEGLTDREFMSIEDIIAFAECVELDDIREVLETQIEYNMAIAEEGLKNNYGANIGKTILRDRESDLNFLMRAYAAAASDARMNGCEMPVVINSGSGNQGITTSVPVIVYAREKGFSHEELLRALAVSNLVTIHLKTGIGRLSAYCGAVSAGCGAAAGLTFLKGGRYTEIAHTIVNVLAVDSGIICDGAKASCAAKISTAVEAGLLGMAMFEDGNQFFAGDGIVKKGVENTIRSIGYLARRGMEQTDKEIIKIMMEN
ncbi:MAG: serine dehydratase subunit alpha family protein [Firmicutes bacterium]|nr:serine dehydratase subunit alpha family protein [Bacillota bacterium]